METKTYKVLKGGESIYKIAYNLHQPVQELIALNKITDPNSNIPEGTILKLPFELAIGPIQSIHYELLDTPRQMHVNNENGVHKFAFGDIQDWADLRLTGPLYPYNSNIEIVAIAHVPINDETASYYMDEVSLGPEFYQTNRPAYTTGFNHTQLSDGYVEPEKKAIPPEREQTLQALVQADKDQPSPEIASLPTTEIDYREVEKAEDLHKWMSTYVPFPEPMLFTFKEEEFVRDHTDHRADKHILASKTYAFAGTFVKDDIEYVRPLDAAKNFLWYGARRDNLISDEELYNTDMTLSERVALKGHLTTSERFITVPLAKLVSQTTRLKLIFKNKNNKEN